ncbi:D-Ala-D-Ala carboxypeptidase family metallohydrolase [Sulfurimonas sp.]|uniref:D-Ala-D-Ala carboxypeptidase family metallohydrolase n=1 Tax=Sulfurimonas sp. TaxID=2022749 RepID=UPI003562EF18
MLGREFWNTIHKFKESEFACKCGCGLNNISKDLVIQLDIARLSSGVPFKLNSACRCVNHNRKEKGSISSSHLKGLAVDIALDSSSDRFKIIKSLIVHGFNRIGVYEDFIHVDVDNAKAKNVIWYK